MKLYNWLLNLFVPRKEGKSYPCVYKIFDLATQAEINHCRIKEIRLPKYMAEQICEETGGIVYATRDYVPTAPQMFWGIWIRFI